MQKTGNEKHRAGSLEKVHARSRVLGHIAHRLCRQGLQLLAVHQVHILPVCVQLHGHKCNDELAYKTCDNMAPMTQAYDEHS